MASRQTSGAAALRYAAALVDTAVEANALEAVEKDIRDLEAMIAGSQDLQNLIRSPLFNRTQQDQAVQELAKKAKFHSLSGNFLRVLVENRRLSMISAIISAFKTDVARRRGEVAVNVEAAFALSDAQQTVLKEALGKAMGSSVNLNIDINRDLIGGMIVTVGSHMIDDSVKRKLERLERAMKSQSNQNLGKQEEVS